MTPPTITIVSQIETSPLANMPAKVSMTRKENIEKENTLLNAKDRAQLTATTAMSVVHVALLRSLLQTGPAANRYFYAVLVMIVISLTLQVVAGLLALLISHMKTYYQKYNEDTCTNCWSTICCCRVVRRREVSPNDIEVTAVRGEGSGDGGAVAANRRRKQSEPTRGCRCVCGTQVIDEDDVALIDRYEQLSAEMVDSIIAKSEAAIQIEFHREKLVTLKSTESASNRLDAEIDKCEQAIVNYEREIRMNQVVEKQYDIISDAVDDLRKKYVLRKVSFWQHTLNYMLYLIFIFNAFITGLGVSSTESKPP